ncbi:hypothetical protein ACWE42_24270 [Sutcliffiella cohnii]
MNERCLSKMEEGKIIKFPNIKIVDDDFEVEFEVEHGTVITEGKSDNMDEKERHIKAGLDEVNGILSSNKEKLDKLNEGIDRLTNHSDGMDYMVAVGSGVLAGIIDSFWVGAFSLDRGKEWSNDKVNKFVVKVAQSQGYEGDDLQGAIRYLESGAKHKDLDIKGFGTPSDSVTDKFGGGKQHHLRDFAHHPTPVGLIFSMLTQFSGKAYGTDKNGFFIIVDVEDKTFIGKDVPQKLLFGTVFWFFHMISDMAGSSSNHGAGTGLPGPLLSLLKEMSSLPIFNSIKNKDGVKEFSLWISKLFNGTLLAKRDSNGKITEPVRFDLRAEIGVAYELGRQAIPVIINECIVRAFYFIRRLAMEIKEKNIRQVRQLAQVDWDKTLPWRNRTIVRMLTIATGTFTLIDLGDAAIRGAVKSGGNLAMFTKEFILRVNFVGVGRFAIAVGTDFTMGLKQNKLRNERMAILSEQLHLMNAKIYYLQADVWIAAESAEKTINEALGMMEETTKTFIEAQEANRQSMQNIGEYRQGIKKHNSGLIEEISDILKWG